MVNERLREGDSLNAIGALLAEPLGWFFEGFRLVDDVGFVTGPLIYGLNQHGWD